MKGDTSLHSFSPKIHTLRLELMQKTVLRCACSIQPDFVIKTRKTKGMAPPVFHSAPTKLCFQMLRNQQFPTFRLHKSQGVHQLIARNGNRNSQEMLFQKLIQHLHLEAILAIAYLFSHRKPSLIERGFSLNAGKKQTKSLVLKQFSHRILRSKEQFNLDKNNCKPLLWRTCVYQLVCTVPKATKSEVRYHSPWEKSCFSTFFSYTSCQTMPAKNLCCIISLASSGPPPNLFGAK